MKYCSNCSKELLDDMQFCPSCGTPIHTDAEHPLANGTAIAAEKGSKKKRKGIGAVIIILLFTLLAGAVCFLYSIGAKANTYNQFADLYNVMLEGATKAEDANILIIDVWRNSIWKTSDAETDKFTKSNSGSGPFYEDFNDALTSLFDDPDFNDDLADIYSLQSEAKALIQSLSTHPKSFDEEYSDFKDCYNLFLKFTNMSLATNGSLNSFIEDHNQLDKEFFAKIKELDIYFN